jgi:hypothetical protein
MHVEKEVKEVGKPIQHLVQGGAEPAKVGKPKAPRRPADEVAIESIVANFNRLSPRGLAQLANVLIEEGAEESLELFTSKFGPLYDTKYPSA